MKYSPQWGNTGLVSGLGVSFWLTIGVEDRSQEKSHCYLRKAPDKASGGLCQGRKAAMEALRPMADSGISHCLGPVHP
jgi:hypothetical protein